MEKRRGSGLLIASLALVAIAVIVSIVALRMPASAAFIGPTGAGGVGSGAISVGATGNVGIGNSNPLSTLQVGSTTVVQTSGPVTLSLGGTYSNAAGTNLKLKLFDGGGAVYGIGVSQNQMDAAVPSGAGFNWYINGAEKMRISSAGNLGIGIVSPNSTLDVGGSIVVKDALTNASARPAIGAARIPGEISSYGSGGYTLDDGFLRLSAGGGTTAGVKTYIDLSGYSTVPDMAENIVFGTVATERMRIATNGNVGIGTTAPIAQLANTSVNAFDQVGTGIHASGLSWAANGQGYAASVSNTGATSIADGLLVKTVGVAATNKILTLNASGTDVMVVQGNGTVSIGGGAGKLTVGTMDPPYTINGEKFATYTSGMTGQKEETTGVMNLEKTANGEWQKTIDFASQVKGSDLWLFAQTTNLNKSIAQMSVLLTPSFDGKVWYKVDAANMTLTLYGRPDSTDTDLSVSYRLTAPRFDSAKWPNTRTDESAGLIINN